jgi:predicted AlkP superfamily phosphohydrolase/phosphomutase
VTPSPPAQNGEPAAAGKRRRTDRFRRRLLVIGLDSIPPEFLFDRFLGEMPNVRRLLARSSFGPLRTTDPPISVPAWPVMFTGVDPGTLGFYGFRHRRPGTYNETYIPSTELLRHPTLWEVASRAGGRVGVMGMPPGYPPLKLNGFSISDFLTPPGARNWTYPSELASRIESRRGRYPFDVVFRAKERDRLFREIVDMTTYRFELARELYREEPWDVFAIHEIGPDRYHHAYWKYFDRSHPRYVAGNRFERTANEYYRLLDRQIGALVAEADERTAILLVSDHGSMAMRGCVCINQYLVDRGYLALRSTPKRGTPIERAEIDWDRTRAWGAGGYYARLFFNVKGREPNGAVERSEVESLRRALSKNLQRIPGPDGRPIPVRVFAPSDVYREVRGDAPDLMVYFDDLRWRSAGTLGHGSLLLEENDTGPDDAVHGWDGVFALIDPLRPGFGRVPRQSILDVTPTLLSLLGLPIPAHVQGRVMTDVLGESATSVPGSPPAGLDPARGLAPVPPPGLEPALEAPAASAPLPPPSRAKLAGPGGASPRGR